MTASTEAMTEVNHSYNWLVSHKLFLCTPYAPGVLYSALAVPLMAESHRPLSWGRSPLAARRTQPVSLGRIGNSGLHFSPRWTPHYELNCLRPRPVASGSWPCPCLLPG